MTPSEIGAIVIAAMIAIFAAAILYYEHREKLKQKARASEALQVLKQDRERKAAERAARRDAETASPYAAYAPTPSSAYTQRLAEKKATPAPTSSRSDDDTPVFGPEPFISDSSWSRSSSSESCAPSPAPSYESSSSSSSYSSGSDSCSSSSYDSSSSSSSSSFD